MALIVNDRYAADGLRMVNFVCGTLFGSGSGRVHDIVLDWIATLKGWKPRGEPSEGFRFASAVAEFALLLKDSKFKGEASFANLIERARNAKGADRDGLRAEFIRLAEAAELMSKSDRPSPQRKRTETPDVKVDVEF